MKKALPTPESILALRKRLGLTQEQFGAHLGVTITQVNRWERGHTKPSPLAVKALVAAGLRRTA